MIRTIRIKPKRWKGKGAKELKYWNKRVKGVSLKVFVTCHVGSHSTLPATTLPLLLSCTCYTYANGIETETKTETERGWGKYNQL